MSYVVTKAGQKQYVGWMTHVYLMRLISCRCVAEVMLLHCLTCEGHHTLDNACAIILKLQGNILCSPSSTPQRPALALIHTIHSRGCGRR